MVAAGRVRVHRGGAEDERRQVRQEGAPGRAGGGDARRASTGLTTAIGDRPCSRKAGFPLKGAARKRRITSKEGVLPIESTGRSPQEAPIGRSSQNEREVGMTRTNVMASSMPQTAGTAATGGSSRARRRLLILPVVLALGLAPVAPALATAGSATTGYPGNVAPPTKTGNGTPGSGTSPSKSTKTPTTTTPAKTVEPATTSSTPTTTTSPAKASTLPFTGFNLTWMVGGALLL